jgi:hypothetical protein
MPACWPAQLLPLRLRPSWLRGLDVVGGGFNRGLVLNRNRVERSLRIGVRLSIWSFLT